MLIIIMISPIKRSRSPLFAYIRSNPGCCHHSLLNLPTQYYLLAYTTCNQDASVSPVSYFADSHIHILFILRSIHCFLRNDTLVTLSINRSCLCLFYVRCLLNNISICHSSLSVNLIITYLFMVALCH